MATKALGVFNKIRDHTGAAVSQMVVENGVVRMKILVKRQDLQQVLEEVTNKKGENKQRMINLRGGPISSSLRPQSPKSVEQRLKDMKRMRPGVQRVIRRQMKGAGCRSYWRPALESIPEAGAAF
ncbi:hypothetical protein SSX86_032540 [Deinandra increscens subsp. villosa]|uniref:Uncharacterized protein n=1 Tax=Deinandra increscens subsp. villosa TaxID=3103831 RepID=A0AAP0GGR4_9ASTR